MKRDLNVQWRESSVLSTEQEAGEMSLCFKTFRRQEENNQKQYMQQSAPEKKCKETEDI